ncbi:MAG: Hsp20/alpha crystallin family protein [Anaerolineaceae bacterium]|nr:Hsp20/alpha crystallin family protein [Anaerolineaceae bacterium]
MQRSKKKRKKDNIIGSKDSGQFRRDILLEENVDDSKIEATFKNGVLTINLAKLSDPTQKKKKISIIKK